MPIKTLGLAEFVEFAAGASEAGVKPASAPLPPPTPTPQPVKDEPIFGTRTPLELQLQTKYPELRIAPVRELLPTQEAIRLDAAIHLARTARIEQQPNGYLITFQAGDSQRLWQEGNEWKHDGGMFSDFTVPILMAVRIRGGEKLPISEQHAANLLDDTLRLDIY